MKLLFILLVIVLNVIAIFAQSSDDYPKFEVGGNYNYQRVGESGGFNDQTGFNGFEISAVKNISRYFGLKFDVSGAYKTDNFSQTAIAPPSPRIFAVKSSVYNYLGGVQIKDNSTEKTVKPFAHVLAGAATVKQKLSGNCPNDVQSICNSYNFSKTGFAAVIGGGIDVKVAKRMSIRAIQVDYNPIQFNGSTSNNFRIGAGIILHLRS